MRPKGRKKVEVWLVEYEHILNVTALEKELGINRGRIQKFIKYNRNLTDEEIESIEAYIKCMC